MSVHDEVPRLLREHCGCDECHKAARLFDRKERSGGVCKYCRAPVFVAPGTDGLILEAESLSRYELAQMMKSNIGARFIITKEELTRRDVGVRTKDPSLERWVNHKDACPTQPRPASSVLRERWEKHRERQLQELKQLRDSFAENTIGDQ